MFFFCSECPDNPILKMTDSLDLESQVSAEMKVVLLGDTRAGKSSIIQQFSQRWFTQDYGATVGVDYDCRILEVDGTFVKIHLWDVSGQDSFLWLAKKHMKEADGFVFVYDVTEPETFEAIPRWLSYVQRCGRAYNLPKLLMGNKYDERHRIAVSASRAKEYAIPEGMNHIEVSAKDGRNINAAFYILANEILRFRKLGCIKSIGGPEIPLQEIHEDPASTMKIVDNGPDYAHMFKILVVGGSRVGKTCLRYRFCRDHFSPEYYGTAGFDYSTRTVLVDNEKVKIQVWDVSGDEVYDQTRKSYYKGANGFIIVYDVCDKDSFGQTEMLLKELDMYEQSDAPKIVVGNKCDVIDKRKVDYVTAREWADGWRVPLIEASARNGANVDALFFKLALALKRQLAPWKRLYNFS